MLFCFGSNAEKKIAVCREGPIFIADNNFKFIRNFTKFVKSGIKFVPVKSLDEVLETALSQPIAKHAEKTEKIEKVGKTDEV